MRQFYIAHFNERIMSSQTLKSLIFERLKNYNSVRIIEIPPGAIDEMRKEAKFQIQLETPKSIKNDEVLKALGGLPLLKFEEIAPQTKTKMLRMFVVTLKTPITNPAPENFFRCAIRNKIQRKLNCGVKMSLIHKTHSNKARTMIFSLRTSNETSLDVLNSGLSQIQSKFDIESLKAR